MMPGRISPDALLARLERPEPLLLLDVRRPGSLQKQPFGISGAIPVVLKAVGTELPDIEREREIAVYCLCAGQASSTRVAQWLIEAGYRRVSVLEGGLPAWRAANLPIWQVVMSPDLRWTPLESLLPAGREQGTSGTLIAERAFLSGVPLPTRRDMAVLFVDMVNSTSLVTTRPAEVVLALVQAFMEIVVQVAVQHCGDVHDFEGDGAMLYFSDVADALPAALALRRQLLHARALNALMPPARIALDAGPLVIGHVGTRERRGLCFIGPSINTAARILKQAPPGGIVATSGVIRQGRLSVPECAQPFSRMPNRLHLKGFDTSVSVYLSLPAVEDLALPASNPEQKRDAELPAS
ncbi:rhodanese-like domain-containing protein [Panacagrimonas sp.]|uniref:rhodanese-like domain-containing protein n=1 Tax=Panacagrimonas sp. TaxID=2480088 RepID=UPI003B524F14